MRISDFYRFRSPKAGVVEFKGTTFDLVWYQHFHKAGGTSFINSAQAAGFTTVARHANGNPIDRNKRALELWNWDAFTLERWIKKQQRRGVTLICCEWGFPGNLFELSGPRILKLASIRNPKARLTSNFLYAVSRGYTVERDILSYIGSGGHHTYADYYTRIISGHPGKAARQGALVKLKQFDHIQILEAPESWEALKNSLSLDGGSPLQDMHSNANNNGSDSLVRALQSVQDADAELGRLCADEFELYDQVREHSLSSHT